MKTGYIQSLGNVNAEPILFFTDDTGYFEAADLGPGRYHVMVDGLPGLSAEIEIPADRFGLYEIGSVKLMAVPLRMQKPTEKNRRMEKPG